MVGCSSPASLLRRHVLLVVVTFFALALFLFPQIGIIAAETTTLTQAQVPCPSSITFSYSDVRGPGVGAGYLREDVECVEGLLERCEMYVGTVRYEPAFGDRSAMRISILGPEGGRCGTR